MSGVPPYIIIVLQIRATSRSVTTTEYKMPTASKGVLVQCDPSIRALILQLDLKNRGIVLEELDNTHLMIKQDMVPFVKGELNRLLSQNIYEPIDGLRS